MRVAPLCLLGLGLVVLPATASSHKRQIGDHSNCGVGPQAHQRVARATKVQDPGYAKIPRGVWRDDPLAHSRPVRTVQKKYNKSKHSRVPRDAPEHPLGEDDEEQPQQQPPGQSGDPEGMPEEQEEDDMEEQEKVIPATPLFVNARYQLPSRPMPPGPIILPHPVDPRVFQQMQHQNRLVIPRPLNRADLFQRIHRDNQNINPEAGSTTATNEETCPDGEDPEADGESGSMPEGVSPPGYNQTRFFSKPNSIPGVQKHTSHPGKDQNYGPNLQKDQHYGPNPSGLPSPTRMAMPPSQVQHMPMIHPRPPLGLNTQPADREEPTIEEVIKAEKKGST